MLLNMNYMMDNLMGGDLITTNREWNLTKLQQLFQPNLVHYNSSMAIPIGKWTDCLVWG